MPYPPGVPQSTVSHRGAWNILALIVCAAAVTLDSVSCPVAVRATGVLIFAFWVPGAVLISILQPTRAELGPSLPTGALSIMILVLASWLPLEFGVSPTRQGFVVLGAACGLLIIVGEAVQRRRRSAAR